MDRCLHLIVLMCDHEQVYLPKQDVKATLVLSGIRAPRTARNANEKSEPFGTEAYDFAVRKTLQRDAEMEVEATDKSGGASVAYSG